jgi:hypothetical protein
LFSTITKCVHIHFHIQKLEKKLVVAEKELSHARKDNQALDISMLKGRRRRPGRRRRRPKRRPRRRPARRLRRRPARRRWTVKAPRMSRLGGSSPPRVVQGLFLLQIRYLLLNDLML